MENDFVVGDRVLIISNDLEGYNISGTPMGVITSIYTYDESSYTEYNVEFDDPIEDEEFGETYHDMTFGRSELELLKPRKPVKRVSGFSSFVKEKGL